LKHEAPIEKLLCALLFLLTRQEGAPPPERAAMIDAHLVWLGDHPETEHLPLLRDTCRRLSPQRQSHPQTVAAADKPIWERPNLWTLH